MKEFFDWSGIRNKLAAMPLLIVPIAATRPIDCFCDGTQTGLLGMPLLLRLDRLQKYACDDSAEADTGYVEVEGVIRNTFGEILVGFAMRPGLICELVKFRVTLVGNDMGDGGFGFFNVQARDASSPARYSESYLCLVCGYHPCYGHGQIRTALKSDDARLEVGSSSQSFDHVLQGALVSWDAAWDRVLERNAYVPHSLAQHCTDLVRISSQKRALKFIRIMARFFFHLDSPTNPSESSCVRQSSGIQHGIDPWQSSGILRWSKSTE